MQITQNTTAQAGEVIVIEPYKYRILVVDVDEACAKMLTWTLEELGHIVEVAYDGHTAIELAKSFEPNIIFLDIGLPGMNGYEICQAMRKEIILQNIVIAAQTGWGEKEHKERSKQAGFDYHLIKPILIGDLKEILLVLDGKRLLTKVI